MRWRGHDRPEHHEVQAEFRGAPEFRCVVGGGRAQHARRPFARREQRRRGPVDSVATEAFRQRCVTVQQDPRVVAYALELRIKARRQLGKGLLGIWFHPALTGLQGHKTVEGATVQQMPAKLLGYQPAHRTRAGPTGAIDGQHGGPDVTHRRRP